MRRLFRSIVRSRETGWAFTLMLCTPYLAFLVWMHAHHEMWRDEIHFWTVARLARGFWDLVTGDRVYDGHPPLWYWYLHVWTWFTQSPVGIQIATIVLALAAAVLFVRYAPFPRYLKLLALCSYYFGYEYTVLSRNYVLGWFFVCLFCALYHPIRVRHLALGLALALLSLSSFYGLALSLFLLAFMVLDQARITLAPTRGSRAPNELALSASPRFVAGLGLALAGIVFCLLTISPPDPNPFSPAFFFDSVKLAALPEMAYRLVAGFLPWRQFSMSDFWALSLTFWPQTSPWPLYAGVALLLLTLLALFPSWRLMLLYLTTVTGLEIFQQSRHEGMPRHWGHYFVAFVAAAWLLRTLFPRKSHWPSTVLLTCICAIQLEAFVIATVIDTRFPFSGGRETAAFIEHKGLQNLPIVGGPDYNMSTVAGFLRRPFYAAETDEVNQTVVFHDRRRVFSSAELMNRAVEISRSHASPVVLVSSEPLPSPPSGVTCTHLFKSRTSTILDETFDVYKLDAK